MNRIVWKDRIDGTISGLVANSCLWCTISSDGKVWNVRYSLRNYKDKPYGEVATSIDDAKEKAKKFLEQFLLKVLI